jgi:diketogulonate reductase-like aldo/keto reductase
MEQINIGSSGLKTSRIGLGTWAIGGWMWGGSDEAQSIATIRAAIERGVTLIDTAPVYGFGHSEEIVSKALAGGALRDKVCIATKVGLAWKGGKPYRDSRPARTRQEIEDSLRRLRTDVIDLYQVHCLISKHRSPRPRARSRNCAAPGRFVPSASATIRRPRWRRSEPTSASMRFTRLTTFSNVRSKRMFCLTPRQMA